jgi:hypothetical protein
MLDYVPTAVVALDAPVDKLGPTQLRYVVSVPNVLSTVAGSVLSLAVNFVAYSDPNPHFHARVDLDVLGTHWAILNTINERDLPMLERLRRLKAEALYGVVARLRQWGAAPVSVGESTAYYDCEFPHAAYRLKQQ